MPRIKLHWLALALCALFAAFSLGYYVGGLPESGTYTILTGHAPDDAPPPVADTTAPESASPNETPPASPAAVDSELRININTADAEELADLPGIGPALGQRIVAYREENGPFAAPEDLTGVPGIGPKKLEDILPFITIGE